MDESLDDVRRDIAATRERLAETIAAIDDTVSTKVEAVTERLDVTRYVRENPWLALAVAVGVGVAVGASGSDRKAARAVASGARKAGPATLAAARGAGEAMKHGASTLVDKVRGGGEDHESYAMDTLVAHEEHRGGIGGLLDRIRDRIDEQAAELARSLLGESQRIAGAAGAPAARPVERDVTSTTLGTHGGGEL